MQKKPWKLVFTILSMLVIWQNKILQFHKFTLQLLRRYTYRLHMAIVQEVLELKLDWKRVSKYIPGFVTWPSMDQTSWNQHKCPELSTLKQNRCIGWTPWISICIGYDGASTILLEGTRLLFIGITPKVECTYFTWLITWHWPSRMMLVGPSGLLTHISSIERCTKKKNLGVPDGCKMHKPTS